MMSISYWLKAKSLPEAIREIANLAERQMQDLELKASDIIPKAQEIKPYPKTSSFEIKGAGGYNNSGVTLAGSGRWFEFKNYYSVIEPNPKQLEERYNNILEAIELFGTACDKVDEDNKIPIENNKKIHEKVALMMKHVGIKPTYYTTEYSSSRAKTPKSVTKQAGYITDLSRDVPTSAGAKPDMNSLRLSVERVYKEKLTKALAIQKLKEQEEKVKSQVHELALLRAVYTPNNAMSSAKDILYEIIFKDKYLYLGHYMLKNRGDWSNGYDYAEVGLNSFFVETDVDQAIYDCVSAYMDENFCDGRVFRDCTYNYNVIFSMVKDEKLMKDYNKIKELIGE